MQIQLSGGKDKANMVDALEDDLVKRYESEKKEKDKLKQAASSGEANFMIFERHFEDKKEEQPPAAVEESKKESIGDNAPSSTEACSIDAEPFQFLDSPAAPSQTSAPPTQLQAQPLEQKKAADPKPNL